MKPSKQRNRNMSQGLTLVELLVSISLITVVSGMFLVAYRQASAEASNIRTQSTIRKISEVLVSRMQDYENYPINYARAPGNIFAVPIPGNAKEALPANNDEFEPKGILLERLRVMLLREMIVQEMPDHQTDIKDTAPIVKNYWTGLVAPRPNGTPWPVEVTASESPRAARLRARLIQAASVLPNQPAWRTIVNNPELLYLVVEDSILNGSPAIELFGKTEIGDTDGDGLLEFLDSYRKPIYWVRWPTGFPDTIRFHPDLLDPSFNRDGFSNYAFSDPLDPRKADPGYRIKQNGTPVFKPSAMAFPLVISTGLDGTPGVRIELEAGLQRQGRYRLRAGSSSTSDVVMPVPYDQGGQAPLVMCDPWFPRDDSSLRLGAITNAKLFEDDITNYSINGAYQ
jgi:type II secretory pathway pseudopilin PulG